MYGKGVIPADTSITGFLAYANNKYEYDIKVNYIISLEYYSLALAIVRLGARLRSQRLGKAPKHLPLSILI